MGRFARLGAALGLLSLTALAGCSNQSADDRGIFRDFGGKALQTLRARREGPQRITLSDAQLNAAPVDVIVLTAPEIDTEVGLVQQAVNRDVVTWVTPEGIAVSLKGGQIVGTAGFGFDLASADVPDIRGSAGRVVRDHFRMDGTDRIRRTRYFCTLSRTGGQQVEVTGRRFATTLISEDCQTEAGETITNRYWIDGRGVMRKSRQFVSPRLGYFQLEDVHTGLR